MVLDEDVVFWSFCGVNLMTFSYFLYSQEIFFRIKFFYTHEVEI